MNITKIQAYMIYDSRGLPTVACEITIANQFTGLSMIPSGASTGENEALELRDNLDAWQGKGVNLAINNINTIISPKLLNFPAFMQTKLDDFLNELDGTTDKAKLGANAILAVSLAYCIACSKAKQLPLYQYIRQYLLNNNSVQYHFPIPLVNVFNGGKHANNNISFQEFMFVPVNQPTWTQTLKVASECFLSLQKLLAQKNFSIAKGDEGGFSVNLDSITAVFELLVEAVNRTSYKLGQDVYFALDVAASEFFHDGKYYLNEESQIKTLTSDELIDYYVDLVQKYPIISIEDPLDQHDWQKFQQLTAKLPNVQIVGDDLYCTNVKLLELGIKQKATTAILIKLNQIGTLSECLQTIMYAQQHHQQIIISHRSGETEDTFIADLCLAVNAHQIKTGSMSRSERLAKYNRISYIDQTQTQLIQPRSIGIK